jgi:hypothetical protein
MEVGTRNVGQIFDGFSLLSSGLNSNALAFSTGGNGYSAFLYPQPGLGAWTSAFVHRAPGHQGGSLIWFNAAYANSTTGNMTGGIDGLAVVPANYQDGNTSLAGGSMCGNLGLQSQTPLAYGNCLLGADVIFSPAVPPALLPLAKAAMYRDSGIIPQYDVSILLYDGFAGITGISQTFADQLEAKHPNWHINNISPLSSMCSQVTHFANLATAQIDPAAVNIIITGINPNDASTSLDPTVQEACIATFITDAVAAGFAKPFIVVWNYNSGSWNGTTLTYNNALIAWGNSGAIETLGGIHIDTTACAVSYTPNSIWSQDGYSQMPHWHACAATIIEKQIMDNLPVALKGY